LEFIDELVKGASPGEHGLPGHLWTLRKIRHIVCLVFAVTCARSTIWKALRQLGLSWKKTKKLLGKAKTEDRLAHLDSLDVWFGEMARGERTLVYVDEAHIHQDLDLGFGWSRRGVPFYVPSTSPGLHAKVNWYGAYDFTNGRVMLWAYPKCNGLNSADFLRRVAEWLKGCPRPTVIWDGSPVHRAKVAMAAAQEVEIEIQRLPGYSPDLNPIEGLWKWIREEVTGGFCHLDVEALFQACKDFAEFDLGLRKRSEFARHAPCEGKGASERIPQHASPRDYPAAVATLRVG
jgi:transposase